MDVKLAKTAGFCFGVKRAVDQVYEQIAVSKGQKKIYTFGPIIHNMEVVRDLSEKGVEICENPGELEELQEGIVVIRSHGVSREIMEILEKKKLDCIDMTCPFVSRIHKIVDEESKTKNIVIIGNAGHPEVEGIRGWTRGNAVVMENPDDAKNYIPPDDRGVCVVSQTTFNYNKFQEFVEIFTQKGYDINIVNTICDATRKRQEEASVIAQQVDAMIVIGDKQSSNSKKLFEICKSRCAHTYFIQTLQELQTNSEDEFSQYQSIGITAGASTPKNIIEEVQTYVRIKF
ncbi:MAG: 4-hydroxy-3-methylbut-2-enyl diphosphate reductase [Lachnospiraceae bacterium]